MKQSPEDEKKGIKISIIKTYVGIALCVLVLVGLLLLNFLNADTEDNAFLVKIIIAVVPAIAAICEVKMKDETKETYVPKEQTALIIIGVVIGIVLLLITIVASDWKDTLLTVGVEMLASITGGFGISAIK